MTPMLESELNELVHTVADVLERHTERDVDRIDLNTTITALVQDHGIQIEED